MFQLIVAVISIALVAALALASIFYGGAAFTRSQLKAQVTTMINQAQQISGAATLYKTDKGGVLAPDVAALVSDSYLAEEPQPPVKITVGVAGAKSVWTLDNADKRVSVPLDPSVLSDVTTLVQDQGTGGISTGGDFYFAL
jgi:hypothetical protein